MLRQRRGQRRAGFPLALKRLAPKHLSRSATRGQSVAYSTSQGGFGAGARVVSAKNVSQSNPHETTGCGRSRGSADRTRTNDPGPRSLVERTVDDHFCRCLQARPGRRWLRRQRQLRLGRPKRGSWRRARRPRLPGRRWLRLRWPIRWPWRRTWWHRLSAWCRVRFRTRLTTKAWVCGSRLWH